jgi:hypothetical protein
MWVFISARLRQWLFFAVAIPLLTVLVHGLRRLIERRTGETGLTRALARAESLGRRKKRK